MTFTRQVFLEETEALVRDLRSLPLTIGPLFSIPLHRTIDSIWAQAVTQVEMHADSLQERLFDAELESASAATSFLLNREKRESSKTWPKRTQAFSEVHGIRVQSFTHWQRMDAIIFVRNSIAHADGNVTRLQQIQKARSNAALLRVPFVDGRFHADEAALKYALTICVQFASELDRACTRLHPVVGQ